MELTVKLFANFRDNRFVTEVRSYPENTTVGDIVTDLVIDHDEVGVLMINSRHCQFETTPKKNDILAIFPVVGGG